MADGQGSPLAARGVAFLRDNRLDWALALGAVAIGVLLYLLDDRTNWSGGFGFDGRFYGELARNFPSAVFGDGQVIPPGLGPYEGPPLTGIDSYYAFRLLPPALAWLGLEIFGLTPDNANVVAVFSGVNALMFGLATFCWCRSAALLGLGDRAKIVGAIALVVNFEVMRTGGYYPVATDQVALGLGSLSLYLWLRGATIPLAICVFAACFTWPFHLVIGAVLLLFPAPRLAGEPFPASEDRRPASWRPPRFGAAVGAVAAAIAVIGLTIIQLGHEITAGQTPQLPVFPLSAAVVGLYVFAVVAFLLPPGGARHLWEVLRGIRAGRLLLALGVLGAVLVATSAVTSRAGFDTLELLETAFWSTSLDPGLFVVVLISYYGPLLLALYLDLPRVASDSWRLGPGMGAVVGAALLGALTTQPREIIDAYPFLVLPGVLAFRRLYGFSNLAIAAFFVFSLLLSRVWLHIGDMSTDLGKLTEFPGQAYYMALGPWTTPAMYGVQLAAIAAIGVTLSLATRRRTG